MFISLIIRNVWQTRYGSYYLLLRILWDQQQGTINISSYIRPVFTDVDEHSAMRWNTFDKIRVKLVVKQFKTI